MSQQTHTIAQRLLNLYRQEHVIVGGWTAVNRVFMEESNDEQVINELANLPTGNRLIAHINNLRSGKTPMDSIEPDLLPYGGMMSGQEINISLTADEISQLKSALAKFQPTPDSLNIIKKLPLVHKFGNDWIKNIKAAIAHDTDLSKKWDTVVKTEKAFNAWNSAQHLLSEAMTERNRARIQAEMSEYETYLPMFGEEGKKVLAKLRSFMSSLS